MDEDTKKLLRVMEQLMPDARCDVLAYANGNLAHQQRMSMGAAERKIAKKESAA
jgi:hypothetical protein